MVSGRLSSVDAHSHTSLALTAIAPDRARREADVMGFWRSCARLEQRGEPISCGIPAESGPFSRNEDDPRSCKTASGAVSVFYEILDVVIVTDLPGLTCTNAVPSDWVRIGYARGA
jgi:hypothetical protein